jgi:hypothetical protein
LSRGAARHGGGGVARALALALLLATAAHAAWYAAGFYAISWDEAGRSIDAFNWRHDSAVLRAGVWLPGHRMLLGSALALYPDLFITPRVVTFGFGILALALITGLAAELFGDGRVTATTALLAALFTPRVVLALAPLSCTPFCCAIVAAMIAVARWLAAPTRARLLLAALAFAVATTIRYEGWVFAATFGALVLVSGRRRRVTSIDVAATAAIMSAFPLLWLSVQSAERGAALAFLPSASAPYDDWHQVWRKNPLTEFLVINALTLNLIGLVSAVQRARSDPRLRAWLFVAAMPLLLVGLWLLFGKRAQSGPSWRMVGVWSLLLLPFTADVVIGLTRRLSPAARRPAAAVAIGVLALVSVGATYRMWQQSRRAFPEVHRTMGRDLNAWLAGHPGARVLIDTSKYDHLNVLVASQRPDAFVPNSPAQRPDDPTAIIAAGRTVPLDELQRRGIERLLFRSPNLRQILESEPGLRRIADYGDWATYETR